MVGPLASSLLASATSAERGRIGDGTGMAARLATQDAASADDATVAAWVEGYRRAWRSNSRDEVRALFADDAVYRFRPDDPEPWVGGDAIAERWLAESDGPEWSFEWHPLLLSDDTATVQGVTTYDDGLRRTVFDTLWVIRFDGDGRAAEFTEWYMERVDGVALDAWVAAYRRAWESSLPGDIRALFTEDAVYHASPSHQPGWVGHDQIVAGWIEHRDEPGDTRFSWERLSLSGTCAVLKAVTVYPRRDADLVFDNVWIIEFAPDGRAREFTDVWVRRPD